MTDFIDPFPTLSRVIDVGGDRYFMGSEKPIELGFKSRQDYLNSFGTDRDTERILRQYMFYELGSKRKLQFRTPEDKQALIKILKTRASQLQASKDFTSSLLKNTLIQRSYLNIEKLIQELEGPDYKGFELPTIPDILPCTKAKKYIKEIPEDRLFQMILEIAWYLLHPDRVNSKIQCDWAKLIQQLDLLRLGDIASEIRGVSTGDPSKRAFNYFKKINLDEVIKKNTITNALQTAASMAKQIDGENAENDIKKQLKTLLSILQLKKYLSNDLNTDAERLNIIDTSVANQIKKDMITNPMKGGSTLEKPLGLAMQPLFNYFKVVFDPIYSLLESAISKGYSLNKTITKKVLIPQLTTILHICNNLNPSETTTGGSNTYGVYRIKNVAPEIISFFNAMMKLTHTYVDQQANDKSKNNFNKQLFSLPKVRLSSLLNRFLDSSTYKDPEIIPYIQFFTVGGNMQLLKAKPATIADETFQATTDFFKATDLYIVCTKSENAKEDIPMNAYEIDYDKIDVEASGILIENIPENYFNKNKDLYMDKLTTLTPYVVFNDAELALSIFILFKELMPK